MRIKNIKTSDDLKLTYYVKGDSTQYVVIFGPPGMSINFWIHIIEALSVNYTVIGTEYRGFPSDDHDVQNDENVFNNIIQDYALILKTESIQQAHLVSWCLGSKIMLGFYSKYPNKVSSMASLNIAFKGHDEKNRGRFSKMIFEIKDRITKEPDSIDRMLKLMQNVGVIPSANFLTLVKSEDENSPLTNLYEIVERESALGSLAFYLIQSPRSLKNYLAIYEALSHCDLSQTLLQTEVRYLILSSEQDRITIMNNDDLQLFTRNRNVTHKIVDKGSHFMLIEYPLKIARLIESNIKDDTN